MYLSIAIKLLVGMLGVIFFLRISGKTQMAQLTPLDSVNSFVLGALVGGVIYNPDTPVWYLVFAFAVWTAANVSLRYLMRFHRIRRAIKGDSVMLVRDRQLVMREFRRNGLEMEQFRTMLRENGIFSMFDVDDVRFETNGRITISRRNEPPESYLLVNGGKVMEDALERSGKGKRWLLRHLRQAGYPDAEKLFCVEWTPGRGFYIVPLVNPTAGMRQRKRFRQTKDGTAGNGLQDNTGNAPKTARAKGRDRTQDGTVTSWKRKTGRAPATAPQQFGRKAVTEPKPGRAQSRDGHKAGARHPTGHSRTCGQIKKGRPKSRPFSIPGAHRYLPTVCASARK